LSCLAGGVKWALCCCIKRQTPNDAESMTLIDQAAHSVRFSRPNGLRPVNHDVTQPTNWSIKKTINWIPVNQAQTNKGDNADGKCQT